MRSARITIGVAGEDMVCAWASVGAASAARASSVRIELPEGRRAIIRRRDDESNSTLEAPSPTLESRVLPESQVPSLSSHIPVVPQLHRQYTSNNPAAPIPPPMHIVTSPVPPPRFPSS